MFHGASDMSPPIWTAVKNSQNFLWSLGSLPVPPFGMLPKWPWNSSPANGPSSRRLLLPSAGAPAGRQLPIAARTASVASWHGERARGQAGAAGRPRESL
eukprot:SAG31_NODE_7846_length_1583_cov_3.441375_4_plen_99_part_01